MAKRRTSIYDCGCGHRANEHSGAGGCTVDLCGCDLTPEEVMDEAAELVEEDAGAGWMQHSDDGPELWDDQSPAPREEP